jgi:hypothetical protein
MLIIGLETAHEALDLDDPEDDEEPGKDCPDHGPYAEDETCPKCEATPAQLGSRIAAARMAMAA